MTNPDTTNALDVIEEALLAARAVTPYNGKLNNMAHGNYDKALSLIQAIRDEIPKDLGVHIERMDNQVDLTQSDLISLIVLAKLLNKIKGEG